MNSEAGHDSGHGGHESAYGPRGEPAEMGMQEEMYHESYEEKRHMAEHAGHAPAGHDTEPVEQDHTQETMSTTEMATSHDLPPFLRTNNRISYFTEYVDFWEWEKTHMILFIFWMAAAVATFFVFPAGSLIMFALAARFRNMAWYDRFVYSMFGMNRTIMLVD